MNSFEEQHQPVKKEKKFDHFLIGFSFALIVPFIVVIIVAMTKLPGGTYSLSEHFMRAYRNHDFVNFMIMGMIPNLLLFLFFYKTERWKSGRGLVIASFALMIFLVLHQTL